MCSFLPFVILVFYLLISILRKALGRMFGSWMEDVIGLRELEQSLPSRSKKRLLQQSEREVAGQQTVKKRKECRVVSLFYLVCLSV